MFKNSFYGATETRCSQGERLNLTVFGQLP